MSKLKHATAKWIKIQHDSFRKLHPRFLPSVVMMTASGTTAMVAIGYAKATEWATEFMIDHSQSSPWMFICTAPLWFIASWMLVKFGAPDAGGSGIPQVLAAVDSASQNRPQVGAISNIRLIAVKILSSLSAILGGGAIGREGPTIQISAAIFELFDGLFKKYARGNINRESLIIAGGGAGLAAAFNTPLGGVVFAIEELASQHFKTFKGMLILAVVTAGYVTQAVLGPYLFIGHPAIGLITTRDTIYGLIMAIFVGLLGGWFGYILFKATTVTRRLDLRGRIILAASVGILMSGICVLLGPDASGGGSLLIRKLLFGSMKEVSEVGWPLVIWRTTGVIATYISGCAGGIFAPSLAAGAALGAMAANLFTVTNHSLIIVLAMIAFLAGATRSPFTSFILVFEMTDRQGAVVPMMAAALLANIAARLVDQESFYEKMKHLYVKETDKLHLSQ